VTLNTFSTEILEGAMHAALDEAAKAAAGGDFPYGAVVVDRSGHIVARAQDRVVRDDDPTCHAEIEAVRAAAKAVGPPLSGHALVSNVEPCAMCSTAAWWAGIDDIAFGLSQQELFSIRPESMDESGLTVAQAQAPFRRRMRVHAGIAREIALRVWRT